MYKGREGLTILGPDGKRIEAGYWYSTSFVARMVEWNKKCIVAPLLSARMFINIF